MYVCLYVSKNVHTYLVYYALIYGQGRNRVTFSPDNRVSEEQNALRRLWSVVRFYDPNGIDRDKIFLRIYTISRVATSALLKPCSVRPTVANLDLLFDFIDPFSPCFC